MSTVLVTAKSTSGKTVKPSKTAKRAKEAAAEAAGPEASKVVKRAHRFRSGTLAKRQIKLYAYGKGATQNLVPLRTINRCIRSELSVIDNVNLTRSALAALYDACTTELTHLFIAGNQVANFNGRITVYSKDLRFASRLRGGPSLTILDPVLSAPILSRKEQALQARLLKKQQKAAELATVAASNGEEAQ